MSGFNETRTGRKEFEVQVDGNTYMVDAGYVLRIEGEHPSHDYPGDSKTKIEYLIVHSCYASDGADVEFSEEIEDIVRQKILT